MALQTYGEKPIAFIWNEERYYAGSDISKYLQMFDGKLYANYPGLKRIILSTKERKRFVASGVWPHELPSSVLLLRAAEVDDLLAGNVEKYLPIEEVTKATEQEESKAIEQAQCVPKPNARKRVIVRCVNFRNVRKFPTCVYSRFNSAVYYDDPTIVDCLVPICLDMKIGRQKLRDKFTWNKNQRLIKPEIFGKVLCADLDLNPKRFVPAIAQCIREQLEAFSSLPPIPEGSADQRVDIKLSIQFGQKLYIDQFEWDMSDTTKTPESFAAEKCAEYHLGAPFVAAIGYHIRAQLLKHHRAYAARVAALSTIDDVPSTSGANALPPVLETPTDAEVENKTRD